MAMNVEYPNCSSFYACKLHKKYPWRVTALGGRLSRQRRKPFRLRSMALAR